MHYFHKELKINNAELFTPCLLARSEKLHELIHVLELDVTKPDEVDVPVTLGLGLKVYEELKADGMQV